MIVNVIYNIIYIKNKGQNFGLTTALAIIVISTSSFSWIVADDTYVIALKLLIVYIIPY